MKAIAILVAAASWGWAQNAFPSVEVRGLVLDRVTRAPIVGARVLVSSGSPGPDGAVSSLRTTTDGGGRFSVNLPAGMPFSVNASEQKYGPGQPRVAAASAGVPIQILLDPLADIRGRVIDAETREPIPGLGLDVLRADIPNYAATGATLQPDGNFIVKDLPGGNYLLRFKSAPQPEFEEIPAQDLAGDQREKALEVPEPAESYGIVVWPGESADLPSEQGFQLSGTTGDTGEIRLRRRKLHNFSGVLTQCADGSYLQLLLYQRRGTVRQQLASMDTRCGAGFRLLNVPDGTFTLAAQGGPPRMFTSQSIDANTRGPLFLNVASIVSIQILIDVDGSPAGTIPDDLRVAALTLKPESAPVRIDAPDRVSPIEYEAHVFGGERYTLSVVPSQAYYLKQVSYNGVPLEDPSRFEAVGASLSTLRLLFSPHPGSVEVEAGPGAVFLLKDGIDIDLTNMNTQWMRPVFNGGVVRFTGLSPGKYHAFLADGVTPAAIEEGRKHAQDVTVEEGQTSRVDLR